MKLYITIFCILFLNFCSLAGSVSGTVRDAQTTNTLRDVIIKVLENEKQSSTDSLGHFTIDILEPGTYTFLILKKGYEEQIINDIYVAGKGIKRLHIDLVPQISSLQRIEVRASSFRRSPDMSSSTKIISADELLRAPGALSDVQRVVQNLPSVSSAGDNINEVVVRGGMPGENLLIMDNIEIPNANHFADQHSGGGVISLINPLLVKGLTFSAGAPPSQYGGKASSVLDVTLRNGNDEIVLGGIDIGMAGAGGHIEGPLWKNSNFMVSGHISFLDFYARIEPTAAIPQFKGLQLKISQKFLSNSLKINGIYGNNY
ncbi:MAG: carboxypeptidase regulatory-like domain-containing protein, partial [Chitinispirillia bacterium]